MSPTSLLKLPGQDLNLEWLDQNQLCYQLHHRAIRLLCARMSSRQGCDSSAGTAWRGVYGMDTKQTTVDRGGFADRLRPEFRPFSGAEDSTTICGPLRFVLRHPVVWRRSD